MNKPILIFDFDGTIADTHQYAVDISNQLSDEFNFNRIEDHEVQSLKDKTAVEIIEHLKVPFLKIPAIISKGKKQYYKDITALKPFKDLKEVLFRIEELHLKMGILSSNTSENIKKFLQHHSLEVFDFIQSTTKLWGKNISLQKFLKTNGFGKEDIIYIGDEIRDIDAAKKLGVKVAAVTWGYNSAGVLEKSNPDYLLHTPEDLLNLCQSL